MKTRFSTVLLLSISMGCTKDCREPPAPPPVPPAPVVEEAAPSRIPDEVINLARNFSRVFFDLDSAELSAEAKSALDENVRIMQARPDIRLEIQGHADERGTTDYNLSLGNNRAQSVLRYMQATGISSTRIKVISYGEERPLASGSTEAAWSRNRRCEFVITWSENTDIQGTTAE